MCMARYVQQGFSIFSGFLLFSLSACIGGGGGGGGQAQFGGAGSEYAAQPGLQQVSAAAALGAGYSGRNIRIGVVDSGIDGRHSEFSGRVHAGGDWQSASDGRIDLHGHGTHVAAILGAAKDGVGMHGVAPKSQLYAYRILNQYGNFGGRSGEAMIPGLVSDARRKNLHILNNSWGSRIEINDISRGEIETTLPRELAAWQSAVNSGMVIVWAAGNQRDNQVSVRAGLPYYFSSLRRGWLTVVSSGASGTEPVYTNRCGLAANWCITAPGGGDDQASNGIWAADTGGGYVRRSGTSMSAPHISGGLALLLEAFPSLSPQAAAARLLQTASYDGLVTADGCTFSRCGAARMQTVFGRGQMDLQSALSPVLGLTLSTPEGAFDAKTSQLSAGSVLYGPLKTALSSRNISGRDRFDGAEFFLAAADFVTPQTAPAKDMMADILSLHRRTDIPPISDKFGWQHYLAYEDRGLLSDKYPERLFDISDSPKEIVYLLDMSDIAKDSPRPGWRFRYRGDAETHSFSSLWQQPTRHGQLWIGQGVGDQATGWFNSVGKGAFTLAGARSVWQFAGVQHKIGRFGFQLEGLTGKSWLKSSSGLLRAGEVEMHSWLAQMQLALGDYQSLVLSYGQPLNAKSGSVEIYDQNIGDTRKLSFSRSENIYQRRIGWQYQWTNGIDISAYYLDMHLPALRGEDKEQRIGAALKIKF